MLTTLKICTWIKHKSLNNQSLELCLSALFMRPDYHFKILAFNLTFAAPNCSGRSAAR